MVKNPPATRQTWVQSLGWKYPLEEGKATLSCVLAWRIPWTEEPGGLHSPRGREESDMTERLSTAYTSTHLWSQAGVTPSNLTTPHSPAERERSPEGNSGCDGGGER